MTHIERQIIISIYIFVAFGCGIALGYALFSKEDSRTFQQKQVDDIRLCTDNGLDAYQGGSGRYYCKPKDI